MGKNVDNFMGEVNAEIKNVYLLMGKMDKKQDAIHTEMQETVKAMQTIVTNCRQDCRQENLKRDEDITSAHKRLDGAIEKTNLGFKEVNTGLSDLRGQFKWYGGALAVLAGLLALLKEHIPILKNI